MFVKDCIDYSEITVIASEQVELMFKKETLMLGMVYRPPSSNNEYFNCVLNQIDHVHSLDNIILTSRGTRWEEIISVSDLYEI